MTRNVIQGCDTQKKANAVFVAFFCFVLFQLSFVFLYSDDYGYMSLSAMSVYPEVDGSSFTISQLVGFLRLHYLTWGGRVLWFFVMMSLLRLGLWPARIALALCVTLAFYFMWRICIDDPRRLTVKSAAILCSLYGLLPLRLVTDGVFWFTAAFIYVAPLAPVLYAVWICLRAARGELIPKRAKVLGFICAFVGGWSQEHVAAAFLAMLGVIFIVCLLKERRFTGKIWIIFGVGLAAAIGAAILLLAPGSGVRLREISAFYPEGVVGKILFGVRNVVRAVFSDRTALPLFALFLLSALLSFREISRRKIIVVNGVSIALYVAFAVVYSVELCDDSSIYFVGAATLKYAVCCLALGAAILRLLLFLHEKRGAGAAVLFIGASAALAVSGAIVTVSDRTLTPVVLLLLPCIGCAFELLIEESSAPAARICLAAVLVVAAVNIGFITVGYARNYGAVVDNDATLRDASARFSNTAAEHRITLKKLPDYRFSGTQLYFDEQEWMLPWYCEYYELPSDVQVEFE